MTGFLMSFWGKISWTIFLGIRASRDGRDNRKLIPVLDRGGLLLQETDVLLIDVEVHKTPKFPVRIAEALLQARVLALQILKDFLNGAPFGGHFRFFSC